MTTNENIVDQAQALSQLFEKADRALSNYKETRDHEDSKRFDQVLVEIQNDWQKLAASYSENSTDSEKSTVLRIMTGRVESTLFALQELREEAQKGIVRIGRGNHIITDSKGLAKMMKDLIFQLILKRDRSPRDCDPSTPTPSD